jgi:hypothetical protein
MNRESASPGAVTIAGAALANLKLGRSASLPAFHAAYDYAVGRDVNFRRRDKQRQTMDTRNYKMQSNPIPDPLADPNRDPEADPLSPPSPGHRPEEPQKPDAPPDGHPI